MRDKSGSKVACTDLSRSRTLPASLSLSAILKKKVRKHAALESNGSLNRSSCDANRDPS